MTPMKRCNKCVADVDAHWPTIGGFWELHTFKGVADVHMVYLIALVRRAGHCLNIYKARTACGIRFETEVDSSD